MKYRLFSFVQSIRAALLTLLYAAVAAISLWIAYGIRFDFAVPPDHQQDLPRVLWLVIPVKLLALILARQMGSMITFFGVPDFFRLNAALLAAEGFLISLRFIGYGQFSPPRGVLLIDFLVCLAAFCSIRLGARLFRERILMSKKMRVRVLENVVIIGAGDTGASLVSDLINMPSRGFRPVAFLDDDKTKHKKFIHGVGVEGTPEDFSSLPRLEGVRRAIIAMPSAPIRRVAEIALLLGRLGIQVETVPALEDLASGKARVSRIRPVEIEDLLGRPVVELDGTSIRHFVENKVVMITGAGGSIGSELCRQIARSNPRRLLLVDQSEPSLFLIEQELNALGFSSMVLPLVADILDMARIDALFATHAPQVIFHAAAHKHVYLMERQPAEAIKNNAVGTRKLAEVAVAHGAEAFVFISTDKAINPTSVMGASKRLAELHLQALHAGHAQSGNQGEGRREQGADGREQGAGNKMQEAGSSENGAESRGQGAIAGRSTAPVTSEGTGNFKFQTPDSPSQPVISNLAPAATASDALRPKTKLMSVRFGNVLGSSGSVVPIFKRQIESGGPVTVTHPEVTRYFMTIPEAVGLVLQASVLGHGGEILVLDMGQPVKIVDLAKNMIELSGYKVGEDIEIKFTGLKPGEKLFEEIQHYTEQHLPTDHPRIMRFVNASDAGKASRMAIEEFEPFVDGLAPNDLKRSLKVVIPEYEPYLE
jgi:FlaA1/EpsC-like NDP-sugar epimerase